MQMNNINPNLKSTKTQVAGILDYMREGKEITALEALNLFGCLRLSARIKDIKERIEGTDEYVYSRYIRVAGRNKEVKAYSIKKFQA